MPSSLGSRGVFQDWRANRGNPKGRALLLLFRLAARVHHAPRPLRLLGLPYLLFYRLVSEIVIGCELPPSIELGPDACIRHAFGLVVNRNARIGARAELFHGVTLGTTGWGTGAVPRLGDDVTIYAHAQIIGGVTIGDGTRIGAGAVVTRDVPPGVVAAGNPARVLRRLDGRVDPQT